MHLYAQCWNDAFTLPFFFSHYDQFVDRYVIYDDDSTDESRTILSSHPRVELRKFVRSEPTSFAISEKNLSDQCWKESRGRADWVIVTDIDEHLLHPDMMEYLTSCRNENITMVPAIGFQMISDVEPSSAEILSERYLHGAVWAQMMKLSIFNPDAIDEINFSLGRHRATPSGNLRIPKADEVLLLHYKYLGKVRTLNRHRELFTGLGSTDLSNGWGHKYNWSEEQFSEDWENVRRAAVDYREFLAAGAANYPLARWWEPYR